jgi:hypothetical protein
MRTFLRNWVRKPLAIHAVQSVWEPVFSGYSEPSRTLCPRALCRAG